MPHKDQEVKEKINLERFVNALKMEKVYQNRKKYKIYQK